ncbi:hypothetical protein D3C73_1511680 [compost metagenome]
MGNIGKLRLILQLLNTFADFFCRIKNVNVKFIFLVYPKAVLLFDPELKKLVTNYGRLQVQPLALQGGLHILQRKQMNLSG